MKKTSHLIKKTFLITSLIAIQFNVVAFYQNIVATAQEIEAETEETQDQEATSATTTSLKERIEKVVEEKESKNGSVAGEAKYNSRAIVGVVERVSESAITVSNNSGSIIIPITDGVELTKDNKSFEISNIEIGNSVIALGLQAGETFTPVKIIIEDKQILPRPQVVAIGAVKEVSKNSLTLESRLNNSIFTFSLDKDTQVFDAEDDEISTLSLFEDVQVVVAGYVSTENDDEQSNTAQVIKALVNLD
jgi:hypothetical protein